MLRKVFSRVLKSVRGRSASGSSQQIQVEPISDNQPSRTTQTAARVLKRVERPSEMTVDIMPSAPPAQVDCMLMRIPSNILNGLDIASGNTSTTSDKNSSNNYDTASTTIVGTASTTSHRSLNFSIILSLPAELLDEIFTYLCLADRYSFALACKHFAQYAYSSPAFLTSARLSSITSKNPLPLPPPPPPSRRQRRRRCGPEPPLLIKTPTDMPMTRVYRDLMQLLSKGWCPPTVHWCDNCYGFRRFPLSTRDLWYTDGGGMEKLPEYTRRNREWSRDLTVAVEGEVCWNHFCPACAGRACGPKSSAAQQGERAAKKVAGSP